LGSTSSGAGLAFHDHPAFNNARAFTAQSSENRGALAGIKVVDLTTARSGPTCVRQFVDLGAEALRVCKPGHVEATPNGMMTLVSHRLVGGSPINKS
jgi:hypothetical protein